MKKGPRRSKEGIGDGRIKGNIIRKPSFPVLHPCVFLLWLSESDLVKADLEMWILREQFLVVAKGCMCCMFSIFCLLKSNCFCIYYLLCSFKFPILISRAETREMELSVLVIWGVFFTEGCKCMFCCWHGKEEAWCVAGKMLSCMTLSQSKVM